MHRDARERIGAEDDVGVRRRLHAELLLRIVHAFLDDWPITDDSQTRE